MINCEECNKYAQGIFQRGEINQDEINKIAFDRHVLKGCDYESEQCEELIPIKRNENGTVTIESRKYKIINGEWYEVKIKEIL